MLASSSLYYPKDPCSLSMTGVHSRNPYVPSRRGNLLSLLDVAGKLRIDSIAYTHIDTGGDSEIPCVSFKVSCCVGPLTFHIHVFLKIT